MDVNWYVIWYVWYVMGCFKVFVIDWCYYGIVDEIFVMFDGDKVVLWCGNIGVLVLLFEIMVVVLFNDVFVFEWVLVIGEVVCVLFELVMMNIGIVLFDDGYY